MNNIQTVLLVVAVVVAGLILSVWLYRILQKIVRKEKHEKVWLRLLKHISVPAGALIITTVLSVVFGDRDNENFPFDLHVIFSILFNLMIAWLLIVAIKSIRQLIMARYDITLRDNLKARKMQTQLVVIERILIVLVILIAFSVSLLGFPKIRQVGISLLASAGIAGIIIGLAAQRSIALFLAGFQIAFTQPIRLDDVVIVEGEWGWIEEITLTYVVVRIWDKRRLIVPITYFIEKPFQNWTRNTAEILGTVFIYVDYGFPVDVLRDELARLLKTSPEWDGKVNVLQVTNATERTLELRALMSAADSPGAWDLRVKIRESLIHFIQEKYPQYLPKARVEVRNK